LQIISGNDPLPLTSLLPPHIRRGSARNRDPLGPPLPPHCAAHTQPQRGRVTASCSPSGPLPRLDNTGPLMSPADPQSPTRVTVWIFRACTQDHKDGGAERGAIRYPFVYLCYKLTGARLRFRRFCPHQRHTLIIDLFVMFPPLSFNPDSLASLIHSAYTKRWQFGGGG